MPDYDPSPLDHDPAGPPLIGVLLIAAVVLAIAGGLMWLLGGTPRVWH